MKSKIFLSLFVFVRVVRGKKYLQRILSEN